MRLLLVLYSILLLVSCEKTEENRMQLSGTVEGLKKGKLYLQKVEDTLLITIDSIEVDGESTFEFSVPVESPEVFYLVLDKNDGNAANDRILFFGEQGPISIQTTRDFFELEARISGSESHAKLEEFQKIAARFNDVNLELIGTRFNAQKYNNVVKADSLQQLLEKNRMRRYLYTLNFALNNRDSYVAPYIILTETPDARLKYLDSIYNALTPEVAGSKYGKVLGTFITEVKAVEKTD